MSPFLPTLLNTKEPRLFIGNTPGLGAIFALKLITGSIVFNMIILFADADDPAGDMLASARVMTERILQKWSWQGGLRRRAASLFSCGSSCGDYRKPTIRLSQLAGNTKETCLPLKVRALPVCWKFTLVRIFHRYLLLFYVFRSIPFQCIHNYKNSYFFSISSICLFIIHYFTHLFVHYYSSM